MVVMKCGSRKKWNLILTLAVLPAVLVVSSVDRTKFRVVASVPQLKNLEFSNSITSSPVSASATTRDLTKKIELKSSKIVVAVVDTGIDSTHPDLRNNLWQDPKTGNFGWDFVRNQPNPKDNHGHGTHVSGSISGVAPDASIMALKYFSERNAVEHTIRYSNAALNWAIDHGADIINYSGGGKEFSAGEFAAIRRAQEKGILVVAAAGNESEDTDNQDNLYYPCAYNLDNILCVAATNSGNGMLPSSNWGYQHVDVAASGENVLSAVPNGKYAYMSGTSQATAYVSGVAALLLSKKRDLKPTQIKAIVKASVDKVTALKGKVFAEGKVNPVKAATVLSKLYSTPQVDRLPAKSKPRFHPAY